MRAFNTAMAIKQKKKDDYGESSIRVLKGLEPVKQRPGMYTLTDNPLHIIQEVIDNASDEVLAGFGTKISVSVSEAGIITVEDDGRGIPIGMHPEEHAPVVELVFTRLHAGGKFQKADGSGPYSFAGGLHGVGVSVRAPGRSLRRAPGFRSNPIRSILIRPKFPKLRWFGCSDPRPCFFRAAKSIIAMNARELRRTGSTKAASRSISSRKSTANR